MRVQQDTFPALVVIALPSSSIPLETLSSTASRGEDVRQINTARVAIVGNRIIIATDGAMGPVVVFEEEVDTSTFVKAPDNQSDHRIMTTKGLKVAFRKDSSCGCGSRLKSWSPFRFISSVADPTE